MSKYIIFLKEKVDEKNSKKVIKKTKYLKIYLRFSVFSGTYHQYIDRFIKN